MNQLDPNSRDRLVSVAKAVAGTIPYIGTLISEILDFSKIEAGQMTLNYGPVNLEAVCQAGLRLVRPAAMKKKITMRR